MSSRIEILETKLMLNLGCSQAESRRRQPVLARLRVSTTETFPASKTDRLRDTLDAAKLRAVFIESLSSAKVQTLEKLCDIAETALCAQFPQRSLSWEIRLTKNQYGWSYTHAWKS